MVGNFFRKLFFVLLSKILCFVSKRMGVLTLDRVAQVNNIIGFSHFFSSAVALAALVALLVNIVTGFEFYDENMIPSLARLVHAGINFLLVVCVLLQIVRVAIVVTRIKYFEGALGKSFVRASKDKSLMSQYSLLLDEFTKKESLWVSSSLSVVFMIAFALRSLKLVHPLCSSAGGLCFLPDTAIVIFLILSLTFLLCDPFVMSLFFRALLDVPNNKGNYAVVQPGEC